MEELNNILSGWKNEDNFERFITILIGICFVLLISYYLKKIVSKNISNNEHKYRTRKAINILGYLLIISVVLFVYSDKLGNIGIAIGLAGAGIAFALQEVITSVAGWINIMTTNSIKIGHRVKIGDIKGDIIDIGVLKTTIMEIGDWVDGDLYNGRITELSNSFMFKEPLQNYSSDYPFLWDEIIVPIRTESDFKLARKIFTEVASEVCGEYAQKSARVWAKMTDKYRIEKAEVQPLITLTFDASWITFTIRYVVDYKSRRKTKDILYTRLLEEIAKYDNIIMIATASIEVTNISQIDSVDSDTK